MLTLSRVVLSVSVLGMVANGWSKPAFVMSRHVYAAPGVECNVYYDGALDSVTPWRYAYEVECESGRCERFRWCWTPTAEDGGKRMPLTLRAMDDDGIVAETTVTVCVARAVSQPDTRILTLATLGASVSNSGYPQRVMKLMRENGYPNYTPVGSHAGFGKPVVPGGIAYDGYGGFRWGDFLRRWWARETDLPQEQIKAEEEALRLGHREFRIDSENYRLKSPLLHVGASGRPELDLAGWLERINGGKDPDVVAVVLAGNDVFRARPSTLDSILDETFADVTKLLTVLRQTMPKTHIAVGLFPLCADQDAFAENYKCLQSAAQYRRNVFAYNRRVLDFALIRNDGNMSIIPMNCAIDTVNSFPKKEVRVHADSEQNTLRSCNALHPLPCGGEQLGDAFYAWLANYLDKRNQCDK